jgi:hypothetical protein
MNDEEKIWLQKRLAFEGILWGTIISLSSIIIAAGLTLLATAISLSKEPISKTLVFDGMIMVILGILMMIWGLFKAKEQIFGLQFPNKFTQKPRFWRCKRYNGV